MLDKLGKLLDGEKWKLERNGVVFENNGGVVQVSATGLFTTPVSFTLSTAQLLLLRNFVNAYANSDDHDIYLVKLNNGIRIAADNEFEQNALDLNEDGTAVIFVGWSSGDYWDRWLVENDGSVHYIGTVEGYRRAPAWLALPVEVQRAG
jgi:hypothetical protein